MYRNKRKLYQKIKIIESTSITSLILIGRKSLSLTTYIQRYRSFPFNNVTIMIQINHYVWFVGVRRGINENIYSFINDERLNIIILLKKYFVSRQ